jgi:hypothetical protein
MEGAWYGGSMREPALELNVQRDPKGDDSGQAIIDMSVRLGHFQRFNYDGVALHCNKDPSIGLLGQCIFYDPEGHMLVTLKSHTPAWSDLRRLSGLANQARRYIDHAGATVVC